MGDFDGRRVLGAAIAVFLSAGVFAITAPLGVLFLSATLIYLMLATTASEVKSAVVAEREPPCLQRIESRSIENFTCSREVVIRNREGWQIGAREIMTSTASREGS
jgi:hypothetical protein